MNRRQFIASTTGLLMAPALVRAASLEYVPRVVKEQGFRLWYHYHPAGLTRYGAYYLWISAEEKPGWHTLPATAEMFSSFGLVPPIITEAPQGFTP